MKLLRALALSLLVSSCAIAQTYSLAPVAKQQFLDVNGVPLAGGLLYTYAAGTSTPLGTSQNSVGTANTNPIVLDSGGFASIWLGTSAYKFVAQNSSGVQQWAVDNIVSSGGALSSITGANGASFLNYTATGTGAVSRTVSSKLAESASIKDFGAVCNGATDDTPAAILAIAAASRILFPDGACYFSGQLIIPSNRTLVFGTGTYTFAYAGANLSAFTGNTPIFPHGDDIDIGGQGTASVLNFTGSPQRIGIMYLPAACTIDETCGGVMGNRLRIHNLKLNGNYATVTHGPTDTSGCGIIVTNCADCEVANNFITGWAFQGLLIFGAGNTGTIRDKVFGNHVDSVGEYGIGLNGYAQQTEIADNEVVNGISVPEAPNGAVGIYVASLSPAVGGVNANDNAVTNNFVSNFVGSGITVQDGATRLLVAHNRVNATAYCVYVGFTTDGSYVARDVSIEANKCYGQTATAGGAITAGGGTVNHMQGLSVRDNEIRSAGGSGIQIGLADSVIVSGNRVDTTGVGAGARTEGMLISSSLSPVIQGNVFRGGTTGINVYNAAVSDALIIGNSLSGNSVAAYSDAGTRTIWNANKVDATTLSYSNTGLLTSPFALANNSGAINWTDPGGTLRRASVWSASNILYFGDMDNAGAQLVLATGTGSTMQFRVGGTGGSNILQLTSTGAVITGSTTISGATTLNGAATIPLIHSTTGARYVCVDTSGNLVSQAAACSGT